MSDQLAILALEPFYGGFRRDMLDTLTRVSRHRWTILKLPPRRLERRLATASRWFAEQLSRHSAGRFDLLFTSDALNLADFFRLVPALSKTPAVVYFHAHQLGDGQRDDAPTDYANLSSASAASEIWFSSKFGRRDFFAAAQNVAARDPELRSQDVVNILAKKARVVPPPVERALYHNPRVAADPNTKPRDGIFVDINGANLVLLTSAMATLTRRGAAVHLHALGPTAGLSPDIPFTPIGSTDPSTIARALESSRFYLGVNPSCAFDDRAIRMLMQGRAALLPTSGGYVELAAEAELQSNLYPVDADSLANAIQRAMQSMDTICPSPQSIERLKMFDAIPATRGFDDRFRALAQPI